MHFSSLLAEYLLVKGASKQIYLKKDGLFLESFSSAIIKVSQLSRRRPRISPRVTKEFWSALKDISPNEVYIVARVKESYPIKRGVVVTPLQDIMAKLDSDL